MLIRNKKYLQQIKDFKNLKIGNIYPTDIDAFLDFGDKVFIFIECKYNTTELSTGQRLALERLCNATHIPNKRLSIVLVATHNSQEEYIDIADTNVSKYFFENKWHECEPENIKTIIESLKNNA